GEGVVVAVIDTGVDAEHPDLAGAVLPGIDLTDAARSGDGHTDVDGHGTAMAGLIAGRGHGPNAGVLGIAPKATILPVRVRTSDYTNSHTTEGIEWAVRQGARVICIANGGEARPTLRRAIEAAIRADVVVVAAAGNRPDDQTVPYPAAYPGVIAAAGVDQQGNHASVSVTGPEVVLAAPAVDIVSTHREGRYGEATGTSNATAIIAGAAALVRAKYPELPAYEVIHRLTATAIDKGPPGHDDHYGHGIVKIVDALTANIPPAPQPTTATQPPPPAAGPPHDPVPPAPLPANNPPIGLLTTSALTLGLLAAAIVWYRRRSS
ncbi:MAG: type VII secretion-associated serine protease mycosin, partial [Micromonosporaceae bacterium]